MSSSMAPEAGEPSSSTAAAPRIKSRPARRQILPHELTAIKQAADKSGQNGLTYNIWYGKWAGGDREDDFVDKTKASHRVDIARDSGYTRGDAQGAAFICLFFARGYCPNGSDCTFLHRLPTATPEQGHDVFGRAKKGNYRDDMGGVGSLQRVNRTLYVGKIHEEADNFSRPMSQGGGANMPTSSWRGPAAGTGTRGRGTGARKPLVNPEVKVKYPTVLGKGSSRAEEFKGLSQTESVVLRHFGEFGEVERIRVLHTRGCGFVTFVDETMAQFAKEAMSNQSLDHDEVLNVRWAADDPDQRAQKRDREVREEEGLKVIGDSLTDEMREAGRSLLELEDGDEGEQARKRRKEEEEAYQKLLAENMKGWEEIERLKKQQAQIEAPPAPAPASKTVQPAAVMPSHPPQAKNGLLSSDALQHLNALREKQQQQAQKTAAVKPAAATGLGGLSGYGSDSDDE